MWKTFDLISLVLLIKLICLYFTFEINVWTTVVFKNEPQK